MARKCNCKLCKATLTVDTAYKVSRGKTSNYYCTKEEYDNYIKEVEKKENCFQTITRILNIPIITPMMKKELNLLNSFYDYLIIERAFKEYENNIKWFLENKEESTEYAKTKYIITIIRNNINSVQKKYTQEQKEIEKLFTKKESQTVEVDIMNINNEQTKSKTNNNDISDFLD